MTAPSRSQSPRPRPAPARAPAGRSGAPGPRGSLHLRPQAAPAPWPQSVRRHPRRSRNLDATRLEPVGAQQTQQRRGGMLVQRLRPSGKGVAPSRDSSSPSSARRSSTAAAPPGSRPAAWASATAGRGRGSASPERARSRSARARSNRSGLNQRRARRPTRIGTAAASLVHLAGRVRLDTGARRLDLESQEGQRVRGRQCAQPARAPLPGPCLRARGSNTRPPTVSTGAILRITNRSPAAAISGRSSRNWASISPPGASRSPSSGVTRAGASRVPW